MITLPAALSRKAEFAAITQAQFILQDRIKEGLKHDPLAKKIVALEKDRKTRRFWLKRDILFTKGDRLYVPKWGDLRRIILKECHDSKWAGHPGIKRTLALVEGTYYWPRMEGDVETFVRTCLICQQDKIEQKKSGGLLEPLPMSKGPWESVSMDLITCLPKSKGSGSIIVVVDRFSKYGTFITAPPDVTAYDTAKLFLKNVVKYWRVPHIEKWADERRRHVEFEVGDQVMVKLLPQQFKSLRKVHKGLIRRNDGPFPMIGRVGNVSYRVQLTPKLKIHPVFYVSFLKPYHGDKEDPERGVSKRAPTTVVTSYDREVEEILSDRTIRRRGVSSYKEYLMKWRDLPDSEASWEAEDLLW
nr:uncharacterized protein [Tanacetum cinerariifolium]